MLLEASSLSIFIELIWFGLVYFGLSRVNAYCKAPNTMEMENEHAVLYVISISRNVPSRFIGKEVERKIKEE